MQNKFQSVVETLLGEIETSARENNIETLKAESEALVNVMSSFVTALAIPHEHGGLAPETVSPLKTEKFN